MVRFSCFKCYNKANERKVKVFDYKFLFILVIINLS